MKATQYNYKKAVIALIFIGAIIRIALAFIIDLGDDEAYFRTFALFPELSNFDKPPMIGWMIQLFTNNLFFNSEIAIRFASIICGCASMWVIYITARRISGDSAGFYSVLLFATSFYFSIYSSLFALPESPQTLFYLLSLYFIVEALFPRRNSCNESTIICNMAYILAGIFIGLSILSEFSSAMIWPALFFYLIFFDREQLKKPALYLSVVTSLLFLIPVYIWYFGYSLPGAEYLSLLFSYNGTFPIEKIVTGLFVVIILNNPINLVLIFGSLFNHLKGEGRGDNKYKLLITISFITALTFLLLSVFSGIFVYSLSHAFIPLLFIAGNQISRKIKNYKNRTLLPSLKYSIYLYLLVVSVIIVNNYTGIINNNMFITKNTFSSKPNTYLSHQFGWNDITSKFKSFLVREKVPGNHNTYFYIIENNYKKAAIVDYYIAAPNKMVVKTIGTLPEIRKYAWITQKLGFFKNGDNAYYIDDSSSPETVFQFGKTYFQKVEKASDIYIMRLGRPVKRYTVYRFLNMINIPVQNQL
ncbi:MAG: glycosyltransferase family 39 protein [Methanolobus sp.]|nr:glycosyltransferase family 39 protein [Methanolobus sp.]